MLIVTTRRVERPDHSTGGRKIWPKGWSGDLPRDLAQDLINAGDAQSIARGGGVEAEVEDGELHRMTKDQLEKLAEQRGLDFSAAKTKADLVALLQG